MLEVFFTQLFIASALCSVAMVILMLLTLKWELLFRASTCVWIGVAVYVRSLFLLPLPALSGKGGQIVQNTVLAIQTRTQEIVSTAEQFIPVSSSVSITSILFSVWLTVFLVLSIKKIASAYRSVHTSMGFRLDHKPNRVCDLLSQARHDMGVTIPIALCASSSVENVCITGIWNAKYTTIYISIPLYTKYKNGGMTDQQLYLFFRHELAHYICRDYLLEFLIELACCVHWFNPLFHTFAKWVHTYAEGARDKFALKDQDDDAVDVMRGLFDLSLQQVRAIEEARRSHRKSRTVPDRHNFSIIRDISFRKRNLDDNRVGFSNFKIFIIISAIVSFTFSLNCTGLFTQTLNFTNFKFPWKTAESSATIPGGEISFAYPIANPTEILTPSVFKRDYDFPVNRLLFTSDLGANVYAPISGEIIQIGYLHGTQMGNTVKIKSDELIITLGHLKSHNLSVGDMIEQKQIIGQIDNSGRSLINGVEVLLTDLNNNPVDVTSFVDGYVPISV